MTGTKKGFIRAGGVIAIVVSVLLILNCLFFLPVINKVDEDAVLDVLEYSEEFEIVDNGDDYTIVYTDDAEPVEISSEDFVKLLDLVKEVLIIVLAVQLVVAIADFVLAVIMLAKLGKDKYCLGITIGLLITSLLIGDILTFAFMIVVLCLKNKKPTKKPNLNNIDEFVQ